MKRKHFTATSSRRRLRTLWSSVAVYSCSDGTLRIEPTWGKRFRKPGLFTRINSAYLVECILRLSKKRINWKARTTDGKMVAREACVSDTIEIRSEE